MLKRGGMARKKTIHGVNMINIISGLIGSVAKPIATAYKSRQDRKQALESGKNKLAMAAQDSSYKLDLKAAEWEALSKQNEKESWIDEYVTIIITSPFVLLFVASIVSGYTGDMRYVNAVNMGIQNLKGLGVDLGELLKIVVLAAVSIKGFGLLKR